MQTRYANHVVDFADDYDSYGEDLFSDEGAGLPPAMGRRTGTRRRPARAMPTGTRRRPATGAATLANLRSFSRTYVRNMIRRGRTIDCADLAIEIWIRFGVQYGVPVSFQVWDSTNRRWLTATRTGVHTTRGRTRVRSFASTDAFVTWVQRNLGARGLIGNTFAVTGGHRRAVAGDVFLWQWRSVRTGRLAPTGHTQILDRVIRGPGGPMTDTITVYQGNLPPVVPQRRTAPASFFYNTRTATLSAGPHTGEPVGPGPRRFNAFRALR